MSEEQPLEHSPVGPSSSKRWLTCTASVGYTKDMPNPTTKYAAEGTFGHNISEYCRIKNKPASDYIGYSETIDGFTFTCDAAFASAIQEFLDYVEMFHGDPFYELRVSYESWVDEGFGTADDIRIISATEEASGACVITDLKMGKGVQEFAKNNTQLMLYALGVFEDLGHMYDIDMFYLNIHQPRLDHIDEWQISVADLLEWAETEARPKGIIATTGEGAEFVPGNHCMFCPGKQVCKAREDYVSQTMIDEMGEIYDPESLSKEEIGAAYSNLEIIRAWCKDIESYTLSLVQAGERIIGSDGLPMKMVAGRSTRSWKDKDAVEKALRAEKVKVADIFKKSLIGIPDAEKLLGKNHMMFDLESDSCLIVKPTGAPVLVPGSDPRPEITTSSDEMDDLGDDDFLGE